jgi:hypothetical protein
VIDALRARLSDTYAGRSWLIAIDPLAGAKAQIAALRDLGATDLQAIAASRGTGADDVGVPDPIVLGIAPATEMMAGIRAGLDALAEAPAALLGAWDPDRKARSIGAIFDDGRPVCGRAKWGARPKAWQALEDKTIVDPLWDAAGVPRAPAEIVPPNLDQLLAAHARVHEGHGTVWSADARVGFNGGAAGVWWVRGPNDAPAAARALAAEADAVRVMPFLDGIPCSIHGICLDDYTIALRPCEMLVFRTGTSRFRYAGAATFWDPTAERRAEMRDIARTVGDHLRATLGYRGAFTIDGVMTADGFRPTELNPRFGAALFHIAKALPTLPLTLLNLAIIEDGAGWPGAALECLLLDAADNTRGGGPALLVPAPLPSGKFFLAWDGAAPRIADTETAEVALTGPSPAGGLILAPLGPETPVGPSAAPRSIAALNAVAAAVGVDLGLLTPAPDVDRRPASLG